jgi:carbonic anhydrase/acetyltransferase-like protein (isoleucine patch superfamily)
MSRGKQTTLVAFSEKLYPKFTFFNSEISMPIQSLNGKSPRISERCFVAENATLIGDVSLGEEASIWFGAVIRTEFEPIRIGKQSNIQDNCVIHTDLSFPVEIGDRVSVGHGAVIHGAIVGSNCLIGMRATLLNGAKIGENCLVAAGSLVTQGKEMPSQTLVIGSPAVAKRKLTEDEIMNMRLNVNHYNEFRAQYLKMGPRKRGVEPS